MRILEKFRAISLLLVASGVSVAHAQSGSPVPVTVENFERAESDAYFKTYATAKGRKLGRFLFRRDEAPVENQTIVRQNRDTLYGAAVFDLDAGPVTLTLPDSGGRFMSLQLFDQDQYTPAVYYGGGSYTLTKEQIGTRYVLAGLRVLVDASDPADVNAGRALQDAVKVDQPDGPGVFEVPNWDPVSHKKVRDAVLVLADTLPDSKRMFGKRGEVDPVRHLLGTGSLWGGNPEKDATYINVFPDKNDGKTIYRLKIGDVPVDGFWSISLYNAKGYFEPNKLSAYNVNDLTAKKNVDGSVDVQFGGCDGKIPNCLPTMKGWNYTVRLYRPRAEILDGRWKFPQAQPESEARAVGGQK
jgi:hypothetical protein